jgi:alkanesulfonate monooxygenase SsuD/methylene tetrahydromethanopterin reductase-like flavin-dependent oxidoreductase (luciferase family)
MFLATPIIAETDAEARAMDNERVNHVATKDEIEMALWGLSYASGGTVDYAQFDLDEPLPDVIGNGEQSSMAHVKKISEGKTLRQAITGMNVAGGLDLVGSPDTVASKMGEIMAEVGGDGFLLYPEMSRRSIATICDGLAPALQKRGLIRSGFDHTTFRDNLLAF